MNRLVSAPATDDQGADHEAEAALAYAFLRDPDVVVRYAAMEGLDPTRHAKVLAEVAKQGSHGHVDDLLTVKALRRISSKHQHVIADILRHTKCNETQAAAFERLSEHHRATNPEEHVKWLVRYVKSDLPCSEGAIEELASLHDERGSAAYGDILAHLAKNYPDAFSKLRAEDAWRLTMENLSAEAQIEFVKRIAEECDASIVSIFILPVLDPIQHEGLIVWLAKHASDASLRSHTIKLLNPDEHADLIVDALVYLVSTSSGDIRERAAQALSDRLNEARFADDLVSAQRITSAWPAVVDHPSRGVRPLHRAAGHDCKPSHAMAALLIDAGADVNAALESDMPGHTPLHFAAWNGAIDVAEALLDAGADVNTSGNGGMTPLHAAVTNRQVKMVEFLIERGADVNAKDFDGHTVLVGIAADADQDKTGTAMARLLIPAGADVNATSKFHTTILQTAVHNGNQGLISLLKKANAKLGERPSDSDQSRALGDAPPRPDRVSKPSGLSDDDKRMLSHFGVKLCSSCGKVDPRGIYQQAQDGTLRCQACIARLGPLFN